MSHLSPKKTYPDSMFIWFQKKYFLSPESERPFSYRRTYKNYTHAYWSFYTMPLYCLTMTSSYVEMPSADIIKTLKSLEKQDFDFNLDQEKTKILKQDLKFAKGWQRILCEDYSSMPYKKNHFLIGDKIIYPLSYSPDPYTQNNLDKIQIHLNDETVTDYLSFYLDYFLSGQHRLRMISHVDDIEWQDDLPPLTRQSLEKDLRKYPEIEKKDDYFFVTTACLFRLSIMEVCFQLRSDGYVEIKDNKLMVEDLPIKSFP